LTNSAIDLAKGTNSCSNSRRFRSYFDIEVGNAGEIAARMTNICDETKFDRVGGNHEDDWNDIRRRLGRQSRRGSRRSNDGHHADMTDTRAADAQQDDLMAVVGGIF
jgi:hypothetical protein